jgi:hypothetical protein
MANDWLNVLGFEQEAVVRMVEYEKNRSRSKKAHAVFKRLDKLAVAWADRGIKTVEDVERAISVDENILHTAQAGDVFENGLLALGGAGADNQQKFIRFARKYAANLLGAGVAHGSERVGDGELFFDILRDRKLAFEIHTHNNVTSFYGLSNKARRAVEMRIISRISSRLPSKPGPTMRML